MHSPLCLSDQPFLPDRSEWGSVIRIGHKGADLIHPGNTIASFEAAVEVGAVDESVAAWVARRAIRERRGAGIPCRHAHSAAHVVECGAMLFMLWPAGASGRGAGMAGMTGHSGVIAGNPAVALILAACMLGYIVWVIDQILTRTRPSPAGGHQPARTIQAPEFGSGRYRGARPTRGARVAACQKITMALAMGYMLLTML